MALQQQLETIGQPSEEAETLAEEYEDEPDFFVGLELVAGLVSTNTKPKQQALPPTGQPWKNAYTFILSNGKRPADAIVDFLKSMPPKLGWAVSGILSLQIDHIRSKPQAGKKRLSSTEYVQELTHLGYSFKMNECNDKIEINNQPITDPVAALIRSQMRDAGFHYTTVMEDAYHAHAYKNRYHPVRDYLNQLTYDGGEHIKQLAEHFIDRDNIFPLLLRRWLIGAVAKAYAGKQTPMLTLDGGQGIGKSHWVRWICPLPAYFIEGSINPDDKDTWVRLASKWVWEVSELGSTTRKADREALKAFISTEWVTVRKAWGRHDMEKPALSSFIGTINNEIGFLSDPTGHRRFITAHLDSINWSYTDLDLDAIWSEARAAFLGGEPWILTPDEQKLVNAVNVRYEIEDPIEGMLLMEFEITNDPNDWLSTRDILKMLEERGLKGNTRGNSMMVASTMTRLGLERGRGYNIKNQRVWGYFGIRYHPIPTTSTIP